VTFWAFLNHWWNLPYLVMLGLVAVFFTLQALGLLAHAAEADHDLDADGAADGGGADGHAGTDGGADADADVDGGAAEHDLPDEDGDAHGEGEHGHALAAFFGVGRVPFMVVWLTLFIFAGFTGLFLNRILQARAGEYRAWFFPLSLLGALGVGVMSVRLAARAVGKLVDVGGRGASTRRELSGRVGVVASPLLDGKFGEVRVRDPRGNELIVHGHLGEGEKPLRQGDEVVLIELENESGLFHVAALKE
jgi:YqiJ-like protein